jgi:hypothetical protein
MKEVGMLDGIRDFPSTTLIKSVDTRWAITIVYVPFLKQPLQTKRTQPES